ncbi:uncharacterized protein LOC103001426 [Balaenoptera acutorostrata]|uniref:Uncharacterized protein LOC103001426 n=1 Tax=Balaenoptera acutorostrata TaxID=9767 RepID=A0ABM3S2U4_BALAC|nr:uncharacterized protein LOC103001426 [Balaenoptera acutorostrata]
MRVPPGLCAVSRCPPSASDQAERHRALAEVSHGAQSRSEAGPAGGSSCWAPAGPEEVDPRDSNGPPSPASPVLSSAEVSLSAVDAPFRCVLSVRCIHRNKQCVKPGLRLLAREEEPRGHQGARSRWKGLGTVTLPAHGPTRDLSTFTFLVPPPHTRPKAEGAAENRPFSLKPELESGATHAGASSQARPVFCALGQKGCCGIERAHLCQGPGTQLALNEDGVVTPRGLLPSCFFLAAPSRGPWDTKWTESPLPEGGEHWTLFPRFCISRCYGVVPSVLLKLPCSTTPLVRSPSNAPTSVPSARVDLGPAGNASEQREEAASLSSGERLGGSCHEGPGTPARLCHVNFSQVGPQLPLALTMDSSIWGKRQGQRSECRRAASPQSRWGLPARLTPPLCHQPGHGDAGRLRAPQPCKHSPPTPVPESAQGARVSCPERCPPEADERSSCGFGGDGQLRAPLRAGVLSRQDLGAARGFKRRWPALPSPESRLRFQARGKPCPPAGPGYMATPGRQEELVSPGGR